MKIKIYILYSALFMSYLNSQTIGYVNSEKVLYEVEEAKTILNKIKALRVEYKNGLIKLQKEFRDLQKKFERQKLVLTDEKRKSSLENIEKKRQEIADYERKKLLNPDGEMYTKAQQLRKPLIEKVLKAIEIVAKDRGVDLILDNTQSIVLFASASIDFTEDVIDYMNKAKGKN